MSSDDSRLDISRVDSRHDRIESDDGQRPHQQGRNVAFRDRDENQDSNSTTMERYINQLHDIAWRHGHGNGRILLGTLSNPRKLEMLGETVVRPPEAEGQKLKQFLQRHGKGSFELEEKNGWVRSLKNRTVPKRCAIQHYLNQLHRIAWKHGDGNGRILSSWLTDPSVLKKMRETLVRPSKFKKLKNFLQEHGNGKFEFEVDEKNHAWVRSLKIPDQPDDEQRHYDQNDGNSNVREESHQGQDNSSSRHHLSLDEYLDKFHDIIWEHGNGRMTLRLLTRKFDGKVVRRPPEATGRLRKVLLTHGRGMFKFEIDDRNQMWVQSLKKPSPNSTRTNSKRKASELSQSHQANMNGPSTNYNTRSESGGNFYAANTKDGRKAEEISTYPRKTFRLQDKNATCYLIDDYLGLQSVVSRLNGYVTSHTSTTASVSRSSLDVPMVAVDCKVVSGSLKLLQIAIPDINNKGKALVFLVDCQHIGTDVVCGMLRPFLTAGGNDSKKVFKLFHEIHHDARAIYTFSDNKIADIVNQQSSSLPIVLNDVVDTQLFAELLMNDPFVGLGPILSRLRLTAHSSSKLVNDRTRPDTDLWTSGPVAQQALEYAALDVSLLLDVAQSIHRVLKPADLDTLLAASRQRVLNVIAANDDQCPSRSICFDTANDYRLASSELMQATRPNDVFFGEPLHVLNEADEVINVLPQQIKSKLAPQESATDEHMSNSNPNGINDLGFIIDRQPQPENIHEESSKRRKVAGIDISMLSDIVLDVGRPPHCWVNDRRVLLSDRSDDIVSQNDVKEVCAKLGRFGTDNRACLSGALHRFSRMTDLHGNITGITARVGRHVDGNAAMLMDFLMSSDKSILILGEPGSGKTTIVRDATRKLAERNNVIVVDTSNEIAGDGTMPHPCIGLARRMMVPSLDKQSSVMVECVQNHTPHVMVVDEIGRPKEVQAARTVKQRGVRIVASAHGSLRKLLKNKELNGLIGGTQQVTIGDAMAKEEAKRKQKPISKTKVQRSSEPTFEVVVEVQRGSRNEWRVIADSASAVDQILDGLEYKAQLRIRDPTSGTMRLAFVDG